MFGVLVLVLLTRLVLSSSSTITYHVRCHHGNPEKDPLLMVSELSWWTKMRSSLNLTLKVMNKVQPEYLPLGSVPCSSEPCCQAAASMVSSVPVGPQLEERDAKSFRVRAAIASRLGGFLLFCGVFLTCVMLKWSVFNAWVMQDAIVG